MIPCERIEAGKLILKKKKRGVLYTLCPIFMRHTYIHTKDGYYAVAAFGPLRI
jgi:hypothetical protein